jgi:staphylococcal nuclease domain-containing protein 1
MFERGTALDSLSRSSIPKVPLFYLLIHILRPSQGINSLEKLMRDFSLHYNSVATPVDFVPKNGELVSAKFSDGAWYRAKVRRISTVKKEAEVTFIDYGNQDTVGFKDIRPLDPEFRALPGQAQDARLRYGSLRRIQGGPGADGHEQALSSYQCLRAIIMLKLSQGFVTCARRVG